MYWQDETTTPRGMRLNGTALLVVLIALAFTAVGSFLAGYLVGRPGGEDRFGVLNEVWNIVEREFYYAKPAPEDRLNGAIQGLLSTLNDRHTVYLKPVTAERETAILRGETGGIGVLVSRTEAGEFLITEVKRGTPADLGGIEAGDAIVKVDDQPLQGKALDDAVNLIRGPLGTPVTLALQRPGQDALIEVTVERGQINIFGEILEGTDIGYVSMTTFNRTAPADLRKAIEEVLAANPRALILDLRDNGGGLLQESIQIADLFLPAGVVATEKTVFGENRTYESKDGELAERIPLIVLVNGSSASASEIVAGALQDRGRAVLVGQRTFGKGSVQALHTLGNGGQLRVTQGGWYTPNQTPIEGRDGAPGGLAPHVEVTLSDPIPPGRDPILESAIEYAYKHFGTF